MITSADINLGTGFGGSVDIPFKISHLTNDLQQALGRIRGTAVIDTDHTERIDDETYWQYQFVVNASDQRVTLERLKLYDGADIGAFTDEETLDCEAVERGSTVEEYERTLAQLLRRTKETDNGGLTTTQGDGILSAVHRKYADYPEEEIASAEVVPFDSYVEIEAHFLQTETRELWRDLTDIDQIGEARATNLILTSGATDPSDLRSHIDSDQWESFASELGLENQ
jgi:hypothetical protein